MKVVYISLTGNIRRFVDKLGDVESLEINQANPQEEVSENYVLVVPSYSDMLTERIYQFIEYKNNKQYLQGVVGSGEKNFNKQYIFSARDIAKRYDVPLLLDFEKSGTSQDVDNFKKEVLKY